MPVNARGRIPRTASVTDRLDAARRNRLLFIEERNRLLALLSTVYPSHLAPATRGWPWVICIHAPGGQMAWHLTNEEADSEWFAHLERSVDSHWDGHKTEDRNNRILDSLRKNLLSLSLQKYS